MAKQRIYISYATKDAALADAVVELIIGVTGLARDEIGGTDIETIQSTGKDIVTYIREQIRQPEVMVLLLTQHYFSSAYCLSEMGAGSAVTANVIPMLVPPLTYQKIQRLIAFSQVSKIDNTDDLNRFITQLQNLLQLGDLNLSRWAVQKKRFLSSLSSMK